MVGVALGGWLMGAVVGVVIGGELVGVASTAVGATVTDGLIEAATVAVGVGGMAVGAAVGVGGMAVGAAVGGGLVGATDVAQAATTTAAKMSPIIRS